MTAQLDFTNVTVCSGGDHVKLEFTLNVDGVVRTRTINTDRASLQHPVDEADIEDFIRVLLKILRAQNPANLRQAILSKVIDLTV